MSEESKVKNTVSVVLPNYNYKNYIISRLDEILAQTYPVAEIIFLDDGSKDGSQEVIKERVAVLNEKYPDVSFKMEFNENNSASVFSQWEKGIKLATSDYVWIAEMDDSSSKDFLKTAMTPIAKDEKIVLSYTNSKLIGSVSARDKARKIFDLFRRGHVARDYVASGKVEIERNLAIYNSIPNVSACVFKRVPELAEIIGGAKKYKLSGDWYFYLELAKIGKVAYSARRLNLHRLSEKSVTSKTDYRTRYSELQRIHTHVLETVKLPKTTKEKMVASEIKLAKNWKLS